jgi:hypothetical protein
MVREKTFGSFSLCGPSKLSTRHAPANVISRGALAAIIELKKSRPNGGSFQTAH